MFEKDVFPKLGPIPPESVRRAHITAVLDDVAQRGANRVAGLLLADLRQMFTFAVNRLIVPGDPTAGLKKSDWNGQSKERERVLSEAEVKQFLKLLPASTLTLEAQCALKIMLATCCRIGEITRARWEHVDLEKGEWFIPPGNSKNAKAHTVSLSAYALTQFKTIRAHAAEEARRKEREVSEWVMPAKHNSGGVCSKSMAKIIGDRQRGENAPMKGRSPLTDALTLSGGRWTPHDLRRTGATLMSALGVRPDVIEKCLNHTEQNALIRVYQRHEKRPEMARAWELLGDRLSLLENNTDNVLTFSRAA
jgi:integrase